MNIITATEMYRNGMSLNDIATHFNTYPNKVRRELIKNGEKLRSHSEAQKLILDKKGHPSKGTTRDEETKNKIGDSLMEYWESGDKPKRKVVKKVQNVDQISVRNKATKGILKASKDGSSIEIFLREGLQKLGYDVAYHTNPVMENPNLEVDIQIPSKNLIIEVDGPSHFKPIWGEEALRRTIKADEEKTGLLLSKGFNFLRIKILRNTSQARLRRLLLKVDEFIKSGKSGLSFMDF